MNKTLRLVTLCLSSAAIGGFIAVRLTEHAQSSPFVSTPSIATSAKSVAAPAPIDSVAVNPPDRTAQSAAMTPANSKSPLSGPVEVGDDYDFQSLAGPSQGLAHRFDSERPDPGWAPRAIDDVNHELEGQPVYSQLSSVEVDCKATLCRIQATLPLETLQAMGPNANFSWGGIVANLMHVSPWSNEFDDIADMESMDNSLGRAQFTTYLHRRPQGIAATSRTAS